MLLVLSPKHSVFILYFGCALTVMRPTLAALSGEVKMLRRDGMYKKMLVPLDTSDFAECVLDHVKEISTTREIPDVVLLSAVEPVTSQTMAYMGPERIKEGEGRVIQGALQYLEKVKNSMSLERSKVSTVAKVGPAADVILDYAANNGVDVIVMSSHGRSGVTRVLLGSTADKVLRRSRVPVFLVPALSCRT